jgi:hypothetical protein
LILTSIREIGHGATFEQIYDKTQELGKFRFPIRSFDLQLALFRLDYLGFTYSWFADPERYGNWGNAKDRCFRLQNKGARLLDAAEARENGQNKLEGFSLWSLLFGPRG